MSPNCQAHHCLTLSTTTTTVGKLKEDSSLYITVIGSVIVGVDHRAAVDDEKDENAEFSTKEDVVDLLVKGARNEDVAVGKITDAEDVGGKLSREVHRPEAVVAVYFSALVRQEAVYGDKFTVQREKGSFISFFR